MLWQAALQNRTMVLPMSLQQLFCYYYLRVVPLKRAPGVSLRVPFTPYGQHPPWALHLCTPGSVHPSEGVNGNPTPPAAQPLQTRRPRIMHRRTAHDGSWYNQRGCRIIVRRMMARGQRGCRMHAYYTHTHTHCTIAQRMVARGTTNEAAHMIYAAPILVSVLVARIPARSKSTRKSHD